MEEEPQRRWRRELGRLKAGQYFTEAERNRVVDLVGTGLTVAEAAWEVGVSHQQVYGRARWDAKFASALAAARGDSPGVDGLARGDR